MTTCDFRRPAEVEAVMAHQVGCLCREVDAAHGHVVQLSCIAGYLVERLATTSRKADPK